MLGKNVARSSTPTRMASVGHAMIALVPGPIRRSASRAEIHERETPSIPKKRGVAPVYAPALTVATNVIDRMMILVARRESVYRKRHVQRSRVLRGCERVRSTDGRHKCLLETGCLRAMLSRPNRTCRDRRDPMFGDTNGSKGTRQSVTMAPPSGAFRARLASAAPP